MTSGQSKAIPQETESGSGNNKGASGFRAPQPKPGIRVAPPSAFRRMRRSIGGTVAYLASWWRY